ncbi:MAG: alpha/beta fold hydrolase [Actinomycetota bacterium]|nr:alpha/beta fold hydrolase [Actinomycetota bacterium]
MDTFSRDALDFDVTDAGPPGGSPVVLLHGFPQTRETWAGVIPVLTAAGHRVLAPAQRGYSPRARPSGRSAYRLQELVADVLALADAAGASTFHLVGHDWGGAVAWAVAALAPERLRSLTSVSTPHPRALARSLATSGQALRSWYMGAFQLPVVPDRLLLAGNGVLLRRSLQANGLGAEQAAAYVLAMRSPGALTAALNWYRALPLDLGAGQRIGRIRVPTLFVWGSRDAALGRAAAEASGRWVHAPYRFEALEGVSHWLPEQEPDRLARLVIEHAAAAGG